MALYLPIRALNRSNNIRIDGQKIVPGTTAYIDISKGSVAKDFASHASIGQVYAVGPVTASNSDNVVTTGGLVTDGAGLTVNVSAGEIRNRSTGVHVAGASGTNVALSSSSIGSGNSRVDLIWWDAATGAVGKTDGTVAVTASAVAPATPAGKVPLATVVVANSAAAPGAKTDVRPRP